MAKKSEPFVGKPTSPDEFARSIIWPRWDPSIAFYEGSRRLLKLRPDLVRESIAALRQRSDLSRYTLALTRIVRTSIPDAQLKRDWEPNLRQLRALFYTPAVGTERQRTKLLEIARNQIVVRAMRFALRQETEVNVRGVEPSWLAVLYAEGSPASMREAKRFARHLSPERRDDIEAYRSHAQIFDQQL